MLFIVRFKAVSRSFSLLFSCGFFLSWFVPKRGIRGLTTWLEAPTVIGNRQWPSCCTPRPGAKALRVVCPRSWFYSVKEFFRPLNIEHCHSFTRIFQSYTSSSLLLNLSSLYSIVLKHKQSHESMHYRCNKYWKMQASKLKRLSGFSTSNKQVYV